MTMFSRNPNFNTPKAIEGYVFEEAVTLPRGHWTLTIEKGDAWIFCNRGNFALNTHHTVTFEPDDGIIRIHRLYIRGNVKYQAVQFNVSQLHKNQI